MYEVKKLNINSSIVINMSWIQKGNVQIQLNKFNSNKIAGFDLDHTLIKPKSGKTHPKDVEDFELCFQNIKQKFLQLQKEDYSLVIFSNQSSFDKPERKEIILGRVEKFLELMGIPINVIISTAHDYCRKPNTGMWEFFNGADSKNSIYVGDAAGRNRNPLTNKKDFSCSDRMFALNVGCKFYTPEKFFEPDKYNNVGIHVLQKTFTTFTSSQPELDFEDFEVVMMIGPQASGKSTLAESMDGFAVVSQDQLKYKAKCLKLLETHLKNNENVVIDNTNGKKSTRAQYLALVKKYNKKVLCINMNVSKEQSMFLVNYRCKIDKKIKYPDVAIHTYFKNYEEPGEEEGFSKIVEMDFVPNFSRFSEGLFNQYY